MEAEPFYEAVGARVRALPGVEAAGFISTLPLGPGGNTSNNVFAAGPSRLAAGQSIQASWRLVDGGYFETMRIPLLRGRTFDGLAPDEARRSIVLSASLAKALFGDDDAVGREVDPGGNNRLLRVIGVVGDVRNRRLAADPRPAFYWSFHRFTYGPMRLVVKSQLPTEQIVAAVRREVRAVDPAAPIFQVWTLDEVRAESLSEERLLLRDAVGLRRHRPAARRARHLRRRRVLGAAADARVRHPPRDRRRGRPTSARLVLRAGGAAGCSPAPSSASAARSRPSRVVETLLFGVTPFDVASYAAATAALALAVLRRGLVAGPPRLPRQPARSRLSGRA